MASLASLAAPSRLPASSFRPSASSARSDRVLRSSSMFMVPPCWLGKRPAKQGNGRRPVWLFAEILSLRTALHLGWEDRRLAPSTVLGDDAAAGYQRPGLVVDPAAHCELLWLDALRAERVER